MRSSVAAKRWADVLLILLRLTRFSFAHWACSTSMTPLPWALVLFRLNDDELLPDLHITGAGVLRAGIGAHLEHVINQDAQAADRQKALLRLFRWPPMRWIPIQTRTAEQYERATVARYLAALTTLKQGVITGVFQIKGASPWAITRAEKLQLSVFLPNDLSLDEWYASVYALPTVWPDVSMLGPAICWSAMTFTTYGRSMMSQACGAISTHNGDYHSGIWKPKGLVGTRSKRRTALYQQVSSAWR